MFCAIRIVVYASHPYIMHRFDTSGQPLRTTMTEETTVLIFIRSRHDYYGNPHKSLTSSLFSFHFSFLFTAFRFMDIKTRFSSSKKWENRNALLSENKEILIASYLLTLRFNPHHPSSSSLLLRCHNLEAPIRILPNHSKPYPNGSSNGSTVALNLASTRSLPL